MASLIADNQNDPVVPEAGSDAAPSESAYLADAAIAFNESPGEGDVLDLADVLLGSPGSHNIEDYLLAIDNGTSSTLFATKKEPQSTQAIRISCRLRITW